MFEEVLSSMEMYWNYRVIYHPPTKIKNEDVEAYFGIHEVWYQKESTIPIMCTIEPIIVGDSVDDIKETLGYIQQSFKRGTLHVDLFKDEEDKT